MPKHYRPPGKKKQGNSAKYITRTKAIHYLQVNLSTFRRLCILKGIFPREPKKKYEGNHKTYYYMKDIQFLLHEPLLEKFREVRAYDKKIRKAVAKRNNYRADCLQSRRPTYKLDRLIKERYPKFIDALRDLDDCLTMIHLFAAIPAVENEKIDVKRIHNCQRLSHEWQAYISRTHSLRKTFISVKGIYYQAEVEGQKITWLTPHALQQVLTDDVDFNVMLTFLEFNETLLSFVNCKLYHSINVKYPPILDPQLEAFAAELYAISRFIDARSTSAKAITCGDEQVDDGGNDRKADKFKELPSNEPGTLMHLIGDSSIEDNEDKATKECKYLFKNLIFFLSREVPKESLQFIIPAFGGVVSWEGPSSPIKESDEKITHQIVDRPVQGHIFLSREYVQPQWVYDCINARILLPTEAYMVGRVPPPHLSPFVDNEAEGYVPEYAETIKRLQAAARKHILPMPGMENEEMESTENILAEGIIDRAEAQEAAEKKQKLMMLEKQYLDELNMEAQGITYSSLSDKATEKPVEMTGIKDTIIDMEQVVEDSENLSKVVMSRKKRRIYDAIQISKTRKKANVELLKERKKKAESKT